MIHRTILIPMLILSAGVSSSTAQRQEVPTLNLTWQGMSLDQTLRGIGFVEGETVEPVFIPNAAFSPRYKYSGPASLRFVRATGSELPASEREPLARVDVPDDTRKALFFFDQAGPESGIRIFPVALKPEPLRPGQVLGINLTERRIAGFHDGIQFELQPGETTVFTPNEIGESRVVQVSVQVATWGGDGWQARVNARYGMTPDFRVRLLFRSGVDGAMKVIPLRERVRESAMFDGGETSP